MRYQKENNRDRTESRLPNALPLCVVSPVNTCDNSALHEYTDDNGITARLAFVEFDDQGQLWDRGNSDRIDQAIWEMAQQDDLLILTFVHGLEA
ncbi:MAG: hypothetical protein O3A63_16920 [Proteobacteria bacterium]|nr:hypothetical protein [Pseudomonadota bacterium]